MIKKLFLMAALLAPSVAYAANPSATLSTQVVPAGPGSGACQDADQSAGIIPTGWACDKAKSADFDHVTSLPAIFHSGYWGASPSPCAFNPSYPYTFDVNGLHMYQHATGGSNWDVSPYFAGAAVTGGAPAQTPFYVEYSRSYLTDGGGGTIDDSDFWLGGNSPDPVGSSAYSGAEIDMPEWGQGAWALWTGGAQTPMYSGTWNGQNNVANMITGPFDGSFHTYGYMRLNGTLSWYKDGQLLGSIAAPYPTFNDSPQVPAWFTGKPGGGCPQNNLDSWMRYLHWYRPS